MIAERPAADDQVQLEAMELPAIADLRHSVQAYLSGLAPSSRRT